MPATAEISPQILIVGGAGRTGRVLAAALDGRGYRVRVMSRDPAAARERLAAGISVVQGDLADDDQVASAVSGAEVVVFIASAGGSVSGRPGGVDYAGAVRVVDAAKAAGVAHMILISSAAVTQPEHPHNCTFHSVLKWKLRGEDHLRASGLPYTVVRPLGLRDREGGLDGVRILQGDRIAFGEDIARADVAAFLADLVGAIAPVPGHALAFSPNLDLASLRGATLEIYADTSVPAATWRSQKDRLLADLAPAERRHG